MLLALAGMLGAGVVLFFGRPTCMTRNAQYAYRSHPVVLASGASFTPQ
jgi:hypothetical protein